MLTRTSVVLIFLVCAAGPARASEQASLSYEYAAGVAPVINFSEGHAGGGIVGDFELASASAAPIFRIAIYATKNNLSDEEKRVDSFEREAGVTLEPGLRHYLTPFTDSWWVAGSGLFDVSRRDYRLANGDAARRSWSVGQSKHLLAGPARSQPVHTVALEALCVAATMPLGYKIRNPSRTG